MFHPRAILLTLALLLVACGPRGTPAPVEDHSAFTGGTVIVRPGDTAYAIARRSGVPVRDLIQANGLRAPYTLAIGQQLRVPQLRLHRVRRGESLTTVSERYGVGRREIVQLNGLVSPFRLHPGQILRIPGGGSRTEPTRITRVTAGAEVVPLPPPRPPGRVARAGGTSRPAAPVTAQKAPAAPAPTQASAPTPAPTVAAPAPAAVATTASGLVWPIAGKVVSRFGPKAGGLHNDGINIRAPRGTPVRAMTGGEVVYAGNELRGFGNLVLIRHSGGLTTAYAHLDRIDVQRGDRIRRGQAIATVGSTGGVDPAQLHFEIRKGRKAIDPVSKLGSSPPRNLG
ncbi:MULTISPECIES: peptidoglycan DD-metalloendopeptidase family protein [unclassified Minwuia]|jgi:murein DD-endopeptidase MepM/ murein hydrolase activator NlpD|uniref:peptidoglycan DD-metalloendopeptidase family protein n=1 Tax=unclassified Minwuia TaxID=2618799 RepID=UPI00247849E8|nr:MULTISPECIES: peptidoglycan DD-metalloendopeptidase family protein [unclassified Minwuia]